jgi:serine protease Do
MLLGGLLLVTILGGAVLARLFLPAQQPSSRQPTVSSQPRPIVQIVRQQPGLPDLADLIDRLCPSVAIIVPHGSSVTPGPGGSPGTPASTYSADGWLVTSAAGLPPMPLDAVFGDGRRVTLADARTDTVSGLAIVKADAGATPLTFSDQAFPRVGQFGLALSTPAGTGCSAAASMIGSDFLTDGGSGSSGYVRLQPAPPFWMSGMPLFATDGRVLGIATQSPPGALIPAPIASVIIDELIRNSPAASTGFGFRAVDFAAPFSSRLGDVRSGAGVALVQPKSPAARAGLQAGDIVTTVDDSPVSSASELNRLLDAASTKVRVTVQRRSEQLDLSIKRSAGS